MLSGSIYSDSSSLATFIALLIVQRQGYNEQQYTTDGIAGTCRKINQSSGLDPDIIILSRLNSIMNDRIPRSVVKDTSLIVTSSYWTDCYYQNAYS